MHILIKLFDQINFLCIPQRVDPCTVICHLLAYIYHLSSSVLSSIPSLNWSTSPTKLTTSYLSIKGFHHTSTTHSVSLSGEITIWNLFEWQCSRWKHKKCRIQYIVVTIPRILIGTFPSMHVFLLILIPFHHS